MDWINLIATVVSAAAAVAALLQARAATSEVRILQSTIVTLSQQVTNANIEIEKVANSPFINFGSNITVPGGAGGAGGSYGGGGGGGGSAFGPGGSGGNGSFAP